MTGLISLNPFFIRSIVQSAAVRSFSRRSGLNPFFIRSIVQCHPFLCRPLRRSLNPFFIRSIVQFDFQEPEYGRAVLIPSSSGQSFNGRSRARGLRSPVLIPSSSGQSFNLTTQYIPTAPVLIPSSSGQSFNEVKHENLQSLGS